MHGWGAYCEGMSTGGSWINTEKNWHINALEFILSILLSLMSVVKDHGIHVKVFSDSATAIARAINWAHLTQNCAIILQSKSGNEQRKKTYILQLPIYQVIRILMQIGNPGNCHMTWNGCFVLKA